MANIAASDPEQQKRADLWGEIEAWLATTTTPSVFNAWIRGLQIGEITEQTMIIEAPNEAAVEWLDHRLRKTVERAVYGVVSDVQNVEFIVSKK